MFFFSQVSSTLRNGGQDRGAMAEIGLAAVERRARTAVKGPDRVKGRVGPKVRARVVQARALAGIKDGLGIRGWWIRKIVSRG